MAQKSNPLLVNQEGLVIKKTWSKILTLEQALAQANLVPLFDVTPKMAATRPLALAAIVYETCTHETLKLAESRRQPVNAYTI